jgi:hypothetical protein
VRALKPAAVVGALPTRGQYNSGGRPTAGEALRDLEPIDAGELNVEQHNVWMQLVHSLQCRLAIGSLACHLEPLRIEHDPRKAPKVGMVVDDQ